MTANLTKSSLRQFLLNSSFTCKSYGFAPEMCGPAETFTGDSPVYFTSVLDSSSATAGAHLLPNSIGLAVGSILAGQIIKQTGKYTTLSAIGLAMPILAIFSAKNWTEQTSELQYWLAIFPAGLGYSIFLCCGLGAHAVFLHPYSSLIGCGLHSRTHSRSGSRGDAQGDFTAVHFPVTRNNHRYRA